ncbi:MAG: transglycosylase SLT domain-containing protein [Synergistaceae bacterium]|nr:transglycosylase SLT domain-containing protein [Synergistaceae bacterium]
MRDKWRIAAFLLCSFTFFGGFAGVGLAENAGKNEIALSTLFQRRSWAAMNEVYLANSAKRELTAAEHALMANALRIQNKWDEAVAILEKHAASFPVEVRPYADMTLLLGYEKLGKHPEALKLAARMEKNAPEELRYYIAYAQFRLLGDSDPDGTKKALNRMLETAETKERKISTLVRLLELTEDRSTNALKLLELQPTNKEAYDVLAARPKPWSPAATLAMGEHAYLKNDYKTAIALFAAIPQNTAGWRKAAYYRAYSLEKTKRYAEALNLWGTLALAGNGYAESSVRRIAALAGKAEKANAVAVLRKVVKGRKGKVQARAMYALAGLLDAKEAKKIEEGLMQAYPDSINTVKILWKRGWDSWNAEKFQDALRCWKRAYAPGLDAAWEPRVLYWIGAAQMSSGQKQEAEKTYSTLARSHPLSCYTFLAKPDAVVLKDGDPPGLGSKPTLLEQWGFVYYAKLKMQRPKASAQDLYRSIELSEWLGEEDGAYAQARLLSRYFASGTTLYRKGLQYLYPRPFKKQVDMASRQYDVEDNFVWAVMRQESAFKPAATSWAGASGLMQLMPGTAKDEAKRIGLQKYDIYDVTDNINMGTAHLARLAKSFDRPEWIMAAYNAGAGNARKWLADGKRDLAADFWIEQVRFDETCDYVQKVLGNLETYRLLYGGKDAAGNISAGAGRALAANVGGMKKAD